MTGDGGDDDVDSLLRGVAAAPSLTPKTPFRSLVGTTVGNFKITRLLGSGGMGAVYAAEHPLIGKRVAVKVLHDELARDEEVVARFFMEAKTVNDIRHENIVDVLDFGQARDAQGEPRAYILMELLEGQSLADRMDASLPSYGETAHVIAQAASALSASHAKGIIHRDIKPENLFLTRRSHDPLFVKLLDFGIVKLTGTPSPWRTRTGAVIGTPLYMSPEQCAGHGRIDFRSDIYSLGVVLYELLTGRVPFEGEGLASILRGHLLEPPAPPTTIAPGVPAALEAIALQCLAKDPAERFPTMGELEVALRAAKTTPGRPTPRHRTTLSRVVGERSAIVDTIPRHRASPWWVVAGVVLAAGLAGIAASRRPAAPVVMPAALPRAPETPAPVAAPTVDLLEATPIAAPVVAPHPPRRKQAPTTTPPTPKQPDKAEPLDDGLL